MRTFVTFLLLICLPLHALAALDFAHQSGGSQSLHHALDHDAMGEHHHLSDGSIEFSDSEDALQHMAEHVGFHHHCAMSVPSVFFNSVQDSTLITSAEGVFAMPDPFEQGPQKPPKFS